MWTLLLLICLPSFSVSDMLCSDEKTTCPEGKQCCTVEGQVSCCNIETDIPESKLKVVAGEEISEAPAYQNLSDGILQHSIFDECSYLTCSGGTCCTKDKCCPLPNAQCCTSRDTCCRLGSSCCNDGTCCPIGHMCCKSGCCPSMTKCCQTTKGCCPILQDCCSDGCCRQGYKCCGKWCCKNSQRCGIRSYTCDNAASNLSPILNTLVLLVMVSVASKIYLEK